MAGVVGPGKIISMLVGQVEAIFKTEFPDARNDPKHIPGTPWPVDWRLQAMTDGGIQLRLFHHALATDPLNCRRFKTLLTTDEFTQWNQPLPLDRARQAMEGVKAELAAQTPPS